MYARILLVGKNRFGEADYLYRVRRSLERAGHAVSQLETWADEPITTGMASTVAASFRPTLVLWDVETVTPANHVLASLRESNAVTCALLRFGNEGAGAYEDELFDTVLTLKSSRLDEVDDFAIIPAAFDETYGQAKCSSLDKDRHGLLVVQPRDEQKSQHVRAMEKELVGGVTSFDPSWAEWYRNPELSNGAYLARRAKYAVFFDDDYFSPVDVPLRIAEGCIVLAEASLKTKEYLGDIEGEIEWFTGSSEAVEIIRQFEGDSSLCDVTRERQWQRCSVLPSFGEVYETVFQKIDARLSDSGNAKRVLSQQEKTKRFVLFGWFGAHNFGDDLLFEIAARKITRQYPESVVQAIGANSRIIERDYGFDALTPERKHEIFEMLRGADSISFYGGLLFDDPMAGTAGIVEMFSDAWIEPTGQAGLCLMAWMLGVPITFMGVGAGPLEDEAPRLAVRTMGLAGARFLPRDEMTCRYLRAAGVQEDVISRKVDLAFSLGADDTLFPEEGASASLGLAKGRYFIVSLRSWNLNPPDFCKRIASALDQITKQTGYVAAFVPFDQDDVRIHRQVAELMENNDAAVIFSERPEKHNLLGLIVDSRFAFAMRLHCSILHHVLGKPAIGLDYNDKVHAHFEAMDQMGVLVALDATADDMVKATCAAEAHYSELSDAIFRKIGPKTKIAQEAFDELFSSVESRQHREDDVGNLTFYPRARSFNAEKLSEALFNIEKLKEQRDQTIRERDAAQAEARGYARSYSYRLGSTLLALPRKVRSIFACKKNANE